MLASSRVDSGGLAKVAAGEEEVAAGEASPEVDSEGPFDGLTDMELLGMFASMTGKCAGMIRGLTGLASFS